jgi:hypothetical protein
VAGIASVVRQQRPDLQLKRIAAESSTLIAPSL